MKTYVKTFIAAAIIVAAGQAVPAHAGVNFNLSIGIPTVVAAVPPPPPVHVPRPSVVAAAPQFVFSPALGFYVSVGTPVDIYYTGGNYYRYDRGYWYSSPRYDGRWSRANGHRLPPQFARYRYEHIRDIRDRELMHRQADRGHRWEDRRDLRRGDRHMDDRDRFHADRRSR